ncbi:MAG: glycosyltransferase family 4 protein [Chloroflexi bacterium]|nr:glycosyltransferase family 4 protein [Chloroflexota bacterium]
MFPVTLQGNIGKMEATRGAWRIRTVNLCLASLHPRILSGQIDSLVGLGRSLLHRGHQIEIVAPFDTTGLLHHALITLDGGSSGLVEAGRRMVQTVPRIIAAARRADLLFLALPTPAFSLVGDIVVAAVPCPVIVSYEGHLAQARHLLTPQRLRESWKTYVPLWGVNNGLFGRCTRYSASRYVVSSNVQREELLALRAPASRIEVISNIVETDKLKHVPKQQARQRLHLPQDRKLIGYIGHFNDVKGVDILAKAFAQVAASDEAVQLVLAWSGQGNLSRVTRYVEGFSDRIFWLGKVPVGTFLSALDALALPYRSTAGQGAFPSLPIEALHVGCPLVTTRLALLAELIGNEPAALLAEPEDTDGLAEHLRRITTDVDLIRQTVQSQNRVLEEHFNQERLTLRYERLFQEVLDVAAETATKASAA